MTRHRLNLETFWFVSLETLMNLAQNILFSHLASDMEAVMSKLKETEDLLEAVQTEKGNSEAQVTNVNHLMAFCCSFTVLLRWREGKCTSLQGNQVFNGYQNRN